MPRSLGPLLVVLVLIGVLPAPARGDAACSVDDAVLSIVLAVPSAPIRVVRSEAPIPGEIQVYEGDAQLGCASPPPIVSTIDLVSVVDVSLLSASLHIDLGGGPFEPGLTPEDDFTPEIEFDVDLGSGGTSDELVLIGSAQADHFTLTSEGINLNAGEPAPDVDVVVREVERFVVDMREGADRVHAAGDENSDPFPHTIEVRGGPGADLLEGGEGPDRILGGEGDDELWGGDGPDRLEGGSGNDVLHGEGGNDVLVGGPGDDEEHGGRGNDLFLQGSEADGSDVISGGLGAADTVAYDRRTADLWVSIDGLPHSGEVGEGDTILEDVEGILGGAGDDVLMGSQRPNLLAGGHGLNEVYGLGGRDVLMGGADPDLLDGGSGRDLVSYANASGPVVVDLRIQTVVGEGGDVLAGIEGAEGGPFDDILVGADGPNELLGLGGDDLLRGLGGPDLLVGGAGADVLWGGPGNDELAGGTGDDRLLPGDGNDLVRGGPGNDTVSYIDSGAGVRVDIGGGTADGAGSDRITDVANIIGSMLDDVLLGDHGPNRLVGLAGNDVLRGSGGADWISGGPGADVIGGGPGNDFIDEGSSTSGADTIRGGSGRDTVSYGARSEGVRVTVGVGRENGEADEGDFVARDVERVVGGRGNDVLIGSAGPNILVGGRGRDVLRGKGGADRLFGGPGNDRLDGGPGVDQCRPGPGRDVVKRCEL